jgi:opacity protein-like surface antigen
MFIPRIFVVVAACVAATVAAAGVASAQVGAGADPPEIRRPFRGLFGGPGLANAKKSLDVTATVFGAYDDNVYADLGGIALSPDVITSGWFGGFETGLAFASRGRRLGFGADLGIGATWYPDQPVAPGYQAAANFTAELRRNLSLSVAETFTYAPNYRLGLFLDPTSPGSFSDPFSGITDEVGIFRESSYRTSTNVSLSRTFRDHSTLAGYYDLTTASYGNEDLNYSSQGVGARYSRQLTRHAGFHLGYSYGVGDYPNNPAYVRRGIHNIDVGADYGRALSISRRTHFSFSTGSALFYANQGILSGEDRRLDYALLGSANLTHEMGRTWTTSVAYQRSVNFHEGFADPFLSQSVSAALQGLISRKLHFGSSVSYSRGLIGAGTTNDYDTAAANAGLQYALSRSLAAYASYNFYRYKFPQGLAVDPRFPPALSRNGVRFGLQTSIPLIRAR